MQVLARALPFVQIALSILLILIVAMQQSEAGLGALSGSDTSVTRHTRRGFEKFVFSATIVIGVLFLASSLLSIVIK